MPAHYWRNTLLKILVFFLHINFYSPPHLQSRSDVTKSERGVEGGSGTYRFVGLDYQGA